MIEPLLSQITNIEKYLEKLSSSINTNKGLKINSNNLFNQRYSRLLSNFEDIKITAERLDQNINKIESLARKITNRHSGVIPEEEREALREQHVCAKKAHTDLKALYLFSKIFLDEFAGLISLILKFEGTGVSAVNRNGGYSAGKLYYSLKEYSGSDKNIVKFRTTCLDQLKAAEIFIAQYRNQHIQHLDTSEERDTKWTNYDMQGNIQILGKRPSLTPKELTFVVKNYVMVLSNFITNTDEDTLKQALERGT